VAEETGGAFDPTLQGSFRDLEFDAESSSVTLRRPVSLDLGAVAKGLAVDMAARDLAECEDFAIDAGGDLYMGGVNPSGQPWTVGIRHPRRPDEVLASVQVSNRAVCTSGDYERGAHIRDPRSGAAAQAVASATVIAESAMLADALATAAFVLGPEEGIAFLRRMGVEGMVITPDLRRYET
jgi:thiamine biosynthesis lipoprotein